MAYFGSIHSSGFGEHYKHIQQLTVKLSANRASVIVSFIAAPEFGDAWFGIYVNARLMASAYAVEGARSIPIVVPLASGTGRQSVVVLRQGAAKDYDMSHIARLFDTNSAQQATISAAWPMEVIGAIADDDGDDLDWLSAWSITGLSYTECGPVDGFKSRGKLDLITTVSGSTITLTLSTLAGLVATGTGIFPGTITLAEANSSGVSGSVAVASGAATETGELYIRWPVETYVLRGLTDPPTVKVATIPFNKADSLTYTDEVLPAGTYYYRLQSVSDTGDIGDQTASLYLTIPGIPVAPINQAYKSGSAAATVLSFTASTTTGATYRAYIKTCDGAYIDTQTIAATAAAGATEITLPAITDYPGTALAFVRAVFGGIEEQNGETVEIEYDATGAYVPKRPNVPAITSAIVSSGNTATCKITYPATGEAAAATQVQLFVRDPEGSYDFTNPASTVTLGALAGNYKTAIATATLANGWHWLTAKAATAAGTQCAGQAPEQLVYASDVNAAPPTAATIVLNRG
jgi:hypothetical protein